MVEAVSNLQCFCKRTIKDKARPDIKGIDCKCNGFGEKSGREVVVKVNGFVVVNKRSR